MSLIRKSKRNPSLNPNRTPKRCWTQTRNRTKPSITKKKSQVCPIGSVKPPTPARSLSCSVLGPSAALDGEITLLLLKDFGNVFGLASFVSFLSVANLSASAPNRIPQGSTLGPFSFPLSYRSSTCSIPARLPDATLAPSSLFPPREEFRCYFRHSLFPDRIKNANKYLKSFPRAFPSRLLQLRPLKQCPSSRCGIATHF